MRERLLATAKAVTRFVLVVVAFGLAVGSIGLSAGRGFCPEPGDGPLAMSVLAAVEDDAPVEDAPADEAPAEDAPTEEAPSEDAPAEDAPTEEEAACPGGFDRCLPPLWSSILLVGEPACHDQAPAQLRGTLVPAFVGATILFAVAWWLRPVRLPAEQRGEVEHPDGG